MHITLVSGRYATARVDSSSCCSRVRYIGELCPRAPGEKAGSVKDKENGAMSEQFAWVPNLARDEWLRPMEAEPFGSVLLVVPGDSRRTRACSILSSVTVPAIPGRGRAPMRRLTLTVSVASGHRSTERTTWVKAAASFGTTMHAEAQ